jgi:hypothetical protein
MIEPTRLCDQDPEGFDAKLIRAARREAPSSSVRNAAAAAGLAGTALLSSKASATGMTLKAIAGASVKGMVAGALFTSAVVVIPRFIAPQVPVRHAPNPVPSALVVPRLVRAPGTASVRDGNSESAVALQAEDTRNPRQRPPADLTLAVSSNPATSAAAPRPRLSDEVRAFELAEASFRRGDIPGAAAALDRYDRDFARGVLAPEAEVLRIELLEAEGHAGAARERARAFLAANPAAPAAQRIRHLLARSEKSGHD